jgi:hypothetical protein
MMEDEPYMQTGWNPNARAPWPAERFMREGVRFNPLLFVGIGLVVVMVAGYFLKR